MRASPRQTPLFGGHRSKEIPMALLRWLKGYPGHPSHPLLTGLLDWRGLPSGTPKRKLANLHLATMLAATAVFAASWFPAQAGYEGGRVHTAALVLALAGEALLLAGGYLGGALVYVHGHRVLSQPQAPIGKALLPGRLSPRPHAAESAPIVSRQSAAPREGH